MTTGLLDLQRRLRELGRIRLGVKAVTKDGTTYPKKLTKFRLTSPSYDLLCAAADIYGGTARKWEGSPDDQFELLTETDTFEVLVPPGQVLSQYWELWGQPKKDTTVSCLRRCDGATELLSGGDCKCPADQDARAELSKRGQACKPTTRLTVMLHELPDIGVWRVESRGFNAAVELPGTVEILHAMLDAGRMLRAQLRLEQRSSTKDGEKRRFVVPVLGMPSVTVGQLMGAGIGTLAIGNGSPQPTPAPAELPSPERAALSAAPKAEKRSARSTTRKREASAPSSTEPGTMSEPTQSPIRAAQQAIAEMKASPPHTHVFDSAGICVDEDCLMLRSEVPPATDDDGSAATGPQNVGEEETAGVHDPPSTPSSPAFADRHDSDVGMVSDPAFLDPEHMTFVSGPKVGRSISETATVILRSILELDTLAEVDRMAVTAELDRRGE